MKKIFCLIVVFFTCFVATAQGRKDIKNDAEEARDTKNDIFIQMNNGKILKFSALKIKAPIMGFEYLEGDGEKLDIAADSIKAFQTDKFYAERINETDKAVIGKLPFTYLFAQRLRNGKIELFTMSTKSGNAYGAAGGSGYVRSYYIRKGKNGDIVPLMKDFLKQMISDNKSLLEEFDKMYKKAREYESATKIIDEYN